MMNMEWCQVAVDPQTRSNDPGCESACRLPETTPTITIYYYYTAVRVCSPCPGLYIVVVFTIKSNCPWWYLNIGPLTPQSDMLLLDHCDLHMVWSKIWWASRLQWVSDVMFLVSTCCCHCMLLDQWRQCITPSRIVWPNWCRKTAAWPRWYSTALSFCLTILLFRVLLQVRLVPRSELCFNSCPVSVSCACYHV